MELQIKLWINGRQHTAGTFEPLTPFEKKLVELIQDWTSEKQVFEVPTSGSTGEPKLIQISRKQIEASIKGTQSALDIRGGGSALLCLPAQYIAGMMMVFRALELGMDLVALEPSGDPIGLLPEDYESCKLAAMTPFQVSKVIRTHGIGKLSVIQNLLIGGAPVNEDLAKQLRNTANAVYETYGMTETVTHIALRRLDGLVEEDAFQVLPGVEVETDDHDRLKIKGAVTAGRWIQTNDVIRLTGKKSFKVLGRFDHIINSGGIKIHPETAEKQAAVVLREMGITSPLLFTGIEDPELGQRVILLLETDQPIESSAIIKRLEEVLPDHWAPKSVHRVKHFHKTANGKVNRRDTTAAFRSTLL